MAVTNMQPEVATQLWEQVLEAVRGKLGSQQAFDTWFRPIVPMHLSPQIADLEVPNAFFVDWIHEHHLVALKQSLAEVLGALPDVRFSAREQDALESLVAPGPAEPEADTPAPVPAVPRASGGPLNPRLTFEAFVAGGGNRFTHAACLAVAQNPGFVYNPLYVFGGSGLGKTHLLHAIGHSVLRSRPGARVTYVPAERFMNEMIYSIQHAQMLPFRNKYRNVDLLLIDDIQFLAGKESTQEEFFYTFNALRDAHKQVVVTSDKPPKDIMLEDRLTSRFNQGLVTDVQLPDLETRIAILRNRCATEGDGARVPDDVLLLIADRIRNNVRDLEGCLVRLLAVASLVHRDMTVELAEEVVHQYVDAEPDHLSPERIIGTVSDRFGVKAEAMCGARRTKTVALPRQVAMYLMRQLTALSLGEIGRMFGNRDHTTVLYACQKVGRLVAQDNVFSEKVNALIATLML